MFQMLHSHRFNNRIYSPGSATGKFSCRVSPSLLPLHRSNKRTDTTSVAALGGLDATGIADLQTALLSSSPGLLAGAIANSTVYLLGLQVLLKGLTPAGVAHSWVLGTLAYSAFGYGGYFLVCLYFILGTAVTKVKIKQKEAEGIAEKRSGRRGPGSVWGSGAAGALAAAASLLLGDPSGLFRIAFVASFASKLSDTCSSEIGKAFGKSTFLVTNFQSVPRGTEGAVSLEGSLAGVAAAIVFAAVGLATGQLQGPGAAVAVAAAAILANYLESLLGATVQGKLEWLNNDVINGLMITTGAGLAILFSSFAG